jgi:hypothetical protein
MSDPIAAALDSLADQIRQRRFVPPATTLVALRNVNGAMARLCSAYNLVVTDSGLVYSVPDKAGLTVVEPEPA